MQGTLRHTFDTDEATYWARVFFDPAFTRRMYLEGLGYASFAILEDREEAPGVRVRTLRSEPRLELPGPLKKLLGDGASFTEAGRFDPASKRWRYTLTLSRLADKVKMGGEIWLEPRGERRVERVVAYHASVSILGLGGLAEGIIERSHREGYEKGAAFTRAWLAQQKP